MGGERLGSQQWSSSSAGVAVPKQPPSAPKTEVQSAAPVSSALQNQAHVVSNAAPVVSNAAIYHAIAKETELFQKELKLLKERHQKLNIEIGSTSEKSNLVQRIEGMSNFLCELNETTQGQALEISALKTLLVEAFAWVEEAKSRQMHSKSSRYIHLAVNQDLDPVLKKYQLTIRNRIHYLDTQLQQIDNNLDNQWLQFQNSYHRKYKSKILYSGDSPDNLRKGIHMPSMEYVYQTILNLQQVLEQQKARLDELETKLKDRAKWELGSSLYDVSSSFSGRRRSPQKSLSYDQDLSSMAESLLAIQLHASKVEGKLSMLPCGKNPLIPKKISSRQRSQLCHLLAHRPMTRVLPSPRRISSALLPIPSSVNDSISPVKSQADKSSTSVSSPTVVQAKPTPTPPRKDQLPAKENIHLETSVMPATTPYQQTVVSSVYPTALKINEPSFTHVKASTAPSFGVSSNPSFGVSLTSSSSSASLQSAPALNFSGPSTQKTLLTNFAAPGMGTLSVSSVAPPKSSANSSSATPAIATSTKGTLSAVSIPSTIAISSLSASTPSTTASQSLGAVVTTTSTPVFNMPSSTKSIPFQSTNISMFGKNPTSTATSSSEGSSWSFTAPSNFSFGPSTKPGISITGNQAVSTTAAPISSSTSVTTTANLTTSIPAFSLNFSAPTSQTSKPSFSLGTKPATPQSSFTLPSTFGSQSVNTSLKKEPLFVFGSSFGSNAAGAASIGSSAAAAASIGSSAAVAASIGSSAAAAASIGSSAAAAASIGTSVAEKSQKQEEKEEKKSDEETNGREVKSTPEVAPQVMEKKQETTEKPASTFSFTSAFGNSAISYGKSSPAVSTAVPITTSTPVSTTPAVTAVSPVYEDITPEKKAEEVSANKGTTEEKPPPARSLFSEFNFKLSGAKSESSGEKPSIFGGSSSPAVTSAPVVPSIFGSPPPTTTSLQSTVTTTTTTSTTLPVISQPEPSTATPNPLSSLGNIVASLGGNNYGKSTPETTKPSNAFTSFSFSLSSKDSATKPLVPDTTAAVTGDGQKTPIKAFPTTSTAEPTSSSTPVAGSLPAGNSDFGQGLANILGQSLPTSPAQPQQTQQPAANPFASAGGLFGSSSSSSPSTASLFGKPSEGSPSVGLFGQPLKQESTTPLFGSPSNTTPATTSGPTFESGSIFGQAASPSSSSSIFGGGGFGSKPFGQTTGTGFSLSGSIFGQSVGASSNTSSIFGSPSASTSAASPFQTPGGFGGSPVFGAMAAASPPSFGGSPSFGSPPSFGGHVFGGSTGGSVFGSALPAQGTTTASAFENLANAQTITFGNLAQSGSTGSMFGGPSSTPTPTFGGAATSGAARGALLLAGDEFIDILTVVILFP
ncbi:hypothetical protein J437_LFUL003552 [Ladona fulva]|uniref:Nuclear pore complex protein n=1 Tax=Ladona fulva TaxID=123851 RepID=A0A8K0NV81_LADFU|nr:hypothetical protein J437_LFUL003552 [Ladona fulva]